MIVAIVDTATYLEPELLLDAGGNVVTTKVNADWTKSAKLRGAATTVTPTITHDAGGVYDVTATFTATGIWYVSYSVVVDGETRRFGQTVKVFDSLDAATFSRVTAGQRIRADHINSLQQAIEEMSS